MFTYERLFFMKESIMKNFKNVISYSLNSLKGHRIKCLGLLILLLFSNVVNLGFSVINQITVDEVIYNRNIHFLLDKMIYIILIMLFAIVLVSIVNKYLFLNIAANSLKKLRMDFFANILNSDYLYIIEKSGSDIYYRMFSDLNIIHQFSINVIMSMPIQIVSTVLILLIMFNWSAVLSIAYLILMFINIIGIHLSKKHVKKIYKIQRVAEQSIISNIQEDFNNCDNIKCYGIENIRINLMKNKMNSFTTIDVKNSFVLSLITIVNNLTLLFWSVISIAIGAYLIYQNNLSIGQFVAFQTLSNMVSPTLKGVLELVYAYPTIKVSYERILEYCKQTNNTFIENKACTYSKKLELTINSYMYPKSQNFIIKNFKFECYPGEAIGIVGGNGTGKTTVLNIISRLITNGDFNVQIDSINIKLISWVNYKANVTYLYQDIKLFNDSIINNITLNRQNIDKDFMMYLIKTMHFDNFINSLPNGLDTNLNGDVLCLSLGNKQKLGIIRTFLTKPKIVLLDEPTSNLDMVAKEGLIELIDYYKKEFNAIVIIATHDKQIMRSLDKLNYISERIGFNEK